MDSVRIAHALRLLADAIEGDGRAEKERSRAKTLGAEQDWISQVESPLGKRKHMNLCKAGTFPSAKKEGKRWLVRRAELDAYIAKHGRAPTKGDNLERHLAELSDVLELRQ